MRCFEKLNKTVLGFGIAVALTILLLSEPALAAQKSDSPTSAKDFLRLGVGALRQNNYPAAIKNFTQAIQRDKQYAPAYANRCLAHLQQDNNQSAEPNCTQALQLNLIILKPISTGGWLVTDWENTSRRSQTVMP